MYNEEQKQRFISDMQFTDDMRVFVTRVFVSLQKYEEAWGADVCTRSVEELRPVINELAGLRSSAAHTKINVIRKYFSWCKNNGIPDVTDAAFQLSPDNTDNIRSQLISGPLAMELFLSKIFRPISDHEVSILFRCFYWFLFSGIRESDAIYVKKHDIDFQSMLIHFNGDDYPIYKEAIDTIRLALELREFYYYHSLYTERKEITRMNSEYIMSASESILSLHYVKTYTNKKKRKAAEKGEENIDLTFDHAFLSGIFYRKFELERAIGAPFTYEDFLDVVEFVTRDSKYSEKAKTTPGRITSMKNRMARHYLEDYNTWKRVFSV